MLEAAIQKDFVDVTGFGCSRLKARAWGFLRGTVEGKEGCEDYSRCSLVVRPEY
jgi:hypothetical protein